MLAEERKNSTQKLQHVITEVNSLGDDTLREAFVAPLQGYIQDINQLRQKADVSISQNREQRDPDFVKLWPVEMPKLVMEIINLRRVLLTTDGQMPTVTNKLDTIALEAWRIREQAGRARTLFASGLANSTQLSEADLRFINLRENDVTISAETISLIMKSGGLEGEIRESYDAYKKVFLQDYKALRESLLEASAQNVPYPVTFDAYFAQSAEALKVVEKLSHAAREAGMKNYTAMMHANYVKFLTVACVLVLVALFAVWIGYYLKQNVTPRLNRMVLEVGKLATNDFTARPDTLLGNDEVGSVAKALQELKRLAEERAEADKKQLQMAREAEHKAQHILSTTAEIADAASSTAAVIDGVASATAEMNSSIASLAQSARAISDLTQNAAQQANQSVQANAALADSTKKISEMVGMIQAIAEQTNLLALNAAIEAARAGDSGRGFAVVADEVKKLASLAEARSNEIQAQIREIAESSEATIRTTDALVNAFGEIERMIQAMSTSMNEQQQVTNEITQNIQTAATSTQQVSVSIEALRRG